MPHDDDPDKPDEVYSKVEESLVQQATITELRRQLEEARGEAIVGRIPDGPITTDTEILYVKTTDGHEYPFVNHAKHEQVVTREVYRANAAEAELARLREQVKRLEEALKQIDDLRNKTKFRGDPFDDTPESMIDADGFSPLSYATKKGLITAANIARDALSAMDLFARRLAERTRAPSVPGGKCSAVLYHGPGHQSSTHCELVGKHVVHQCTYGEFSNVARWHGKEKLTGFFDEPPDVDGKEGE